MILAPSDNKKKYLWLSFITYSHHSNELLHPIHVYPRTAVIGLSPTYSGFIDFIYNFAPPPISVTCTTY